MAGVTNPIVHDFAGQLAYSESANDEPFWQSFYRQVFPTLIACTPTPGDVLAQRNGVDRVIVLANGTVIRIDEKKRPETYPDILLEYISVDTTGAPGWIEKELTIEYLAYAFMDTKQVYLLDWQILKRAWRKYGNRWKARYRTIKAPNRSYNTISVAIPTQTLMAAMQEPILVDLKGD